MSRRGRSGFLSYLLLLNRLLQFEHRAREVEAPWGPQGRGRGRGRASEGDRSREGMGVSHLHPRPAPPQPNSSSWRGELSAPAATVLCLHGAQSNLSALQLAVL